MTSNTVGIADPRDIRRLAASRWAAEATGQDSVELAPVSGDASFRRYFRFTAAHQPVILMDAPPEKEDSAPFIDIANRLRRAGLKAPEIFRFDLEQGFGLLEDFGDTLYREMITEESVDGLFPGLFRALDLMARRVDAKGLPRYDETVLQKELDLFEEWYLGRHKSRPMTRGEKMIWSKVCKRLIDAASEQPQVFVHKDFHSCNLLKTPDGPGIIDFQDGLMGPISYDFISLVWDRYIAWPRIRIETWMREVYELFPVECSFPEWVRYCDWMGLQRNLKIVGIFARLRYRDEKQGYVEMIPRFYQYLLDVLPRYSEFDDFRNLLEQSECAP